MRRLIVTLSTLALLSPVVAGALTNAEITAQINALLQQITALQTQLQSLQTTPVPQLASSPQNDPSAVSSGQCDFPRNLALGSSGQDVLALQQYLTSEGVLGGVSSAGYFDAATEAAVQRWQASHGIVSSGTPATTGFGAVGPRTRSLLAINCPLTLSSSQAQQTSCPVAPRPTTACAGTWNPVANANGCTTGWQCAVPLAPLQQNSCSAITLSCPAGTHLQVGNDCAQSCVAGTLSSQAPVNPFSASPVSGPASLSVTFSAADVAIDTYSINFGDGFASQMSIQSCAGPGASICTYQVSHSYTQAGAFTATLSGTKAGQVGTKLITVR